MRRKRKRDTAGVSSTAYSSSFSSFSVKKSKAKVGWKPLDQSHKDERGGDTPGLEASAVPHRTTREQGGHPSPHLIQLEIMQVLEALHLARSEQELDLSVGHSYGELSGMDTDTPDDGENATLRTSRTENGLIVVLDTNILLSHLIYVKKIRSHGLGGMGFALVLIPWVVLQELDSLKDSNRMKGSIVHLVTPAVHFIHTCLKKREPRLWGQSMQQALEGNRYALNRPMNTLQWP
ncbi:hypothetical protein CRUP_009104 [Coryphaenoides rupestris]|nr:hypothetical protein CRUP_009104 [Coryphaenoides rupestris]